MPWTTKDVDKHKKGLSAKQKRQWVATANSALARCKAGKVKPKGGGSCDAYAIKVANAAVSSSKRDWALTEIASLVRLEFANEFQQREGSYLYVELVFPDYLIVRKQGRFYKVGYTLTNGDVQFTAQDRWVEVEHDFKKVKKAQATNNRAVLDSPIRAMDDHPGHYRCYAVRFRGEDDRDLYNTYFDGDTDYCMNYFSEWPWLYHHGTHPKYSTVKVGVWNKRGIDDIGIFVEGEITTHGVYKKAVETLIGEEVLFPSSQAISSMIAVEENGHVRVWPICEVSSTVLPADVRASPVSPAAQRAVRALSQRQEDSNMGWKDKLRELIEVLPDVAPVRTAVAADDDPDPEPDEAVTVEGTKGEGGDSTEDIQAGDEGVAEAVRTAIAELNLEPMVRAIQSLDGAVQKMVGRLDQVEETVQGLGRSEPERIKAALSGEEWYSKLFVASRSGEPADDVEAKPESEKATTLQPGESVFGRICATPSQ